MSTTVNLETLSHLPQGIHKMGNAIVFEKHHPIMFLYTTVVALRDRVGSSVVSFTAGDVVGAVVVTLASVGTSVGIVVGTAVVPLVGANVLITVGANVVELFTVGGNVSLLTFVGTRVSFEDARMLGCVVLKTVGWLVVGTRMGCPVGCPEGAATGELVSISKTSDLTGAKVGEGVGMGDRVGGSNATVSSSPEFIRNTIKTPTITTEKNKQTIILATPPPPLLDEGAGASDELPNNLAILSELVPPCSARCASASGKSPSPCSTLGEKPSSSSAGCSMVCLVSPCPNKFPFESIDLNTAMLLS